MKRGSASASPIASCRLANNIAVARSSGWSRNRFASARISRVRGSIFGSPVSRTRLSSAGINGAAAVGVAVGMLSTAITIPAMANALIGRISNRSGLLPKRVSSLPAETLGRCRQLWRLLQGWSNKRERREVYLGRGAIAERRLCDLGASDVSRVLRAGRPLHIEEQAQQEIGRPIAELASIRRNLQITVWMRGIE